MKYHQMQLERLNLMELIVMKTQIQIINIMNILNLVYNQPTIMDKFFHLHTEIHPSHLQFQSLYHQLRLIIQFR